MKNEMKIFLTKLFLTITSVIIFFIHVFLIWFRGDTPLDTYSTLTDFARLRGWSTFSFLPKAIW